MNWIFDHDAIDWDELSALYRIAPLGEKDPAHLKRVFANSMYKCFAFDGRLVGAGRALADGGDCAYLCDVAVHPDYQGRGLGQQIVTRLKQCAAGYKKIILYANPGTESFYRKLGFRPMRTAMAIFGDEARAIRTGLVDGD